MKSFALLSALAALAVASPTRTLEEPPTKRSKLPTVSVSGNGKHASLETIIRKKRRLI